MSLSTGGTLSGTPTAGGGQYTFTVTASNNIGTAAQQQFSLTVDQAVSFPSPTVSDFLVGSSSNTYTFSATGYPQPSFTSSDLPTGLSLNTGGILTGTPAAGAGVYTFTVKADNGVSTPVQQQVSLTVDQTPMLQTIRDEFAPGVQNSFTLVATGFPAPTISAISLPSWLSLTNNVLSGTPPTSAAGTSFPLQLTLKNSAATINASFALYVLAAPQFSTGTPSSTTFITGSSGTFTFSTKSQPGGVTFHSPNLPAGLNLSLSGVLTGTPTHGAGTYTFQVQATNIVGETTTESFTLKVIPAPQLTGPIHYYSVNPSEGTATTGQKSIIRHIQLTFSEAVYIDPGAISVMWLGGTNSFIPGTLAGVTIAGNGTTTITLSFTGALTQYRSLVDGRYQLMVHGSGVHALSASGPTMATDISQYFFRLYGDANGDGVVNAADVTILKTVYGRRPTSSTAQAMAAFNLTATGNIVDQADANLVMTRAKNNVTLS
jgi:hypothetical protein